jgi:aminoglycoside phosphotransferase (APT) family kinase protein
MAVADELLPDSVPRLFFCDRDRALFVMEYLDSGWTTWKSRLWAGEFSGEIAEQVGGLLGSLHRNAWGRKDLARQFDNLALFHELRVAPYLLTAAQRHPDLASPLESEARRLDETRITLVHGDYSPKNLMTDGKRVKILDAEVACFGDPAFDIAFVLNHLLLKAVRFPEHFHAYATLRDTFIHAYRVAVADCWSGELEVRSAKLVLMLMLARIAGKSPVEYFDAESPEAKRIVRFVSNQLTDLTDHFNFSQLNCHFQNVFLHNHTH